MEINKEEMRMSVPKQMAFGLAVVAIAAAAIIWLMPSEKASHQERPIVSEACAAAFADAASVSDVQDTHEDLFPAYAVCTSIEEWIAANELYPEAIDGAEPVDYARTVCANNQQVIGETLICRAVGSGSGESGV